MELIFIQLAIILFTAFIVSYIVKLFRQPLIVGYIIAGIVISPFIIKFGASQEIINIFSKLGIAFLLFIVGLHLNPKGIKRIGGLSLALGIGQMVAIFIIGYFVSYIFLGFGVVSCLYIGIALMFSSTIIITKLLSDKGDLDSLHGKISIGVLIVQDLVAVAVLMFISSMHGDASLVSFAIKNVFLGILILFVLFLFGSFILPKFTTIIAKSQELLFLFSLCWCFLIAGLFNLIGFTIEIGALVAGVVLSISPYSTEISSKIRPLRDFFLIIFFIILGLNIQFSEIKSILFNAVVLSLLVLIFKPLSFMSLMALFGHTKKNNFLVGTTLAQISEFSLIILTLGLSLGHISKEVLSTLTLTGLITITFSAYFINYSNQIYKKIGWLVSIFEKKQSKDREGIKKKYDAVLFGYNRIGFNILKSLKKINKDYLIVDFNPDTIKDLQKLRMPCLYGDASDFDFLQELNLGKLQLVISTVPDFETNEVLTEVIRLANSQAIIIVRAHQINDALDLYKKGANYVLTPHFLGGEYLSKMISHLNVNPKGYEEEKTKHIKMLKEILKKEGKYD